MGKDKQSISESDLSKKTGREDKKAYVAYKGRVVDVTESPLWKDGAHMKRHKAGHDLTDAFEQAPHGADVLDRYPQVGILEGKQPPSEEEKREVPWLIRKFPFLERHPHPMTVHFPIVFALAASFFLILSFIIQSEHFAHTSWHCLGAGLLTTPVAMGTGLYTWKYNYSSQLIKQVKRKLVLSPILLVLLAVTFIWGLLDPHIAGNLTGSSLLFVILVLVQMPLVVLIGWYGATITFPLPKK